MRPLSTSSRHAMASTGLTALGLLAAASCLAAEDAKPAANPQQPPTNQQPTTAQPPPTTDTAPLYVRSRRLSDADLAKKREGIFFTGLPEFTSDPVAGQGFGLRANIYWNGRRTDPLFAYTPYRAKLTMNAQVTSGDARELTLSYDMPYVKGSRWRLKVDGKAREDPTNLYFGLTQETLNPLRLPTTPAGGPTYDTFSQFETARKTLRPGGPGEAAFVTDSLSNRFRDAELMLNVKADYAIGDGKWRVLGGYEYQRLSYATFGGRQASAVDPVTGASTTAPNGIPLLDRDVANRGLNGLQGGVVSILQQALIYDTRDFEPDPTRGVYFEIANELSLPAIGSQFLFDKLFLQARVYKKLPFGPRTVFAARIGAGNIFGDNAPFFEFQDQWSPDGSINALGGARSLRGYVANRFLGRAVAFANAELRVRLGEKVIAGQRFGLNVVPFVDVGTVRDQWAKLNLDKLRWSYGVGLRLAWNQSTIISFDIGKSGEGQLIFLGIGQPF